MRRGAAAQPRLAARLEAITKRIERACDSAGRDPASVRVVAVTKGQPVEAVRVALDVGLRDIGESRVQEAAAKRDQLGGSDAVWHMIGHVQRNKAKTAAALFDVVHSVDSAAVGRALGRQRAGEAALRILLEVDATGIATRTGVPAAQAGGVLAELLALDGIEVVGLMTIAPPGDPATAERCFAAVAALRDALSHAHGVPLAELSMGMSDDFEAAVAQGATLVRLGRGLFGERPAPGTAPAPRVS